MFVSNSSSYVEVSHDPTNLAQDALNYMAKALYDS